MDPNVVLPLASSVLSFIFAILLLDQWRERRRPYQLIWAAGMLWYGLSAGTEFAGGWQGWSEPLYRAWYLIGAIWLVGWLGLGTVQLLRRTRFGYAVGVVTLLAAFLAVAGRARYPDATWLPIAYGVVGLVVGLAVLYLTWRGSPRWADVTAAGVVLVTVTGAVLAVALPFANPGWSLDPTNHIPTPDKVPGDLRLLAALPNLVGASSLVLGALYSAYVFMPKRRLVRYTLAGRQSLPAYAANLARAVAGVPVNFVASIPEAYRAGRRGELNSRVPATLLIGLGALVPGITSGLQRFGGTTFFFVGELAGVILIFFGYLVSIEVMPTIRVPFTKIVLRSRQLEA